MTAPVHARKRFGQHFLTSPQVIDSIVAAIAPRAGDTLVEIGPGRGAITEPLAKSGVTLHAIEFDRDLAGWLEERFAGTPNVSIVQADALRFDFASLGARLRVVGNLPYNISTPLLFHLLEFSDSIEDLHFMLQKEVVDRMAASPGTKAYGRLTIMLGCRMTVEPLFDVPPDAFDPPPKVTSAVVRLRPRPPAEIVVENVAVLSKLVAQAFSQRRKTLRNALRAVATPEALEAVGIDPGSRAETVPVETWAALSNYLAARSVEFPSGHSSTL
jgi:16S rRNA (adenine1518-N6/adenine1519-N6)-dimethyltransferase